MKADIVQMLKCSLWRTYLIFLRNWVWIVTALIALGIVSLFLYNFDTNLESLEVTKTCLDDDSFLVHSSSKSRLLMEDAFCGLNTGLCFSRPLGKLSKKTARHKKLPKPEAVPLLWSTKQDDFFHHVMSEAGKNTFHDKIFTEFSLLEKIIRNIHYPTVAGSFESEFDLNSVAKDAFFLNFLLKTHLRGDEGSTSAILNQKLSLNQILPNSTKFVSGLCSPTNVSTAAGKDWLTPLSRYLCSASYEDIKAFVTAIFNHMDWQGLAEKIRQMNDQQRQYRFTAAENQTLSLFQESLSQLESIRHLLKLFNSLQVVLEEFAGPRKILRHTGWDSQRVQTIIAEAFELMEGKIFKDSFLSPAIHFTGYMNKTSTSSEIDWISFPLMTSASFVNVLLKYFSHKSECTAGGHQALMPSAKALFKELDQMNDFVKDFEKKNESEKITSFDRNVERWMDLLYWKKAEVTTPFAPCEEARILSDTFKTINNYLMKEDVRQELTRFLLSNRLIRKTSFRFLKGFLLSNASFDAFEGLLPFKLALRKTMQSMSWVVSPIQQILEDRNETFFLRNMVDHVVFHLTPQAVTDNIKHVVLNDVPRFIMDRRNGFKEKCSSTNTKNLDEFTPAVCSLQDGLRKGFSSPFFDELFESKWESRDETDFSDIFVKYEELYKSFKSIENLTEIPLKRVEEFATSWDEESFAFLEKKLSHLQSLWPLEIANRLLQQWCPQLSHLMAKGTQVLELFKSLMEEIHQLKDFLEGAFPQEILTTIRTGAGGELPEPFDPEELCPLHPSSNTEVSASAPPEGQTNPGDVTEMLCHVDLSKMASLLNDFNDRVDRQMKNKTYGDFVKVDRVWKLIKKLGEYSQNQKFRSPIVVDGKNSSSENITISEQEETPLALLLRVILQRNLDVDKISNATLIKLRILNEFLGDGPQSSSEEFPQLRLLKEVIGRAIPAALREGVLFITTKPSFVHILHPAIMKEISICHIDLTSFGKNIERVGRYLCHLPYEELGEELDRLLSYVDHLNNQSVVGNLSLPNELVNYITNMASNSHRSDENETRENSFNWKEIFPSLLGVTLEEIYENGSTIWAATLFPLVSESRSPKPKSEKLQAILVALGGRLRQMKLLLGLVAGGDVWKTLRESYQDKLIVLKLFDYIELSPRIVKDLLQLHINSPNIVSNFIQSYDVINIRNIDDFCLFHRRMINLEKNGDLSDSALASFLDYFCDSQRRSLILDQLDPKSLPVIANLTMEPDAAVLGLLLDSVTWKLFMLSEGFLVEGHLQLPEWVRPYHWKEAKENLQKVFRRPLTDHLTRGLILELNQPMSRSKTSYHEKLLKFLMATQLWVKDMEAKHSFTNSSLTRDSFVVHEFTSLAHWFTQTQVFYEYMSGVPVEDIVHALCEDDVTNLDPEKYKEDVQLTINEMYMCEVGRITYEIDPDVNTTDRLQSMADGHDQTLVSGVGVERVDPNFVQTLLENVSRFIFGNPKRSEMKQKLWMNPRFLKDMIKRVVVVWQNFPNIHSLPKRPEAITRMKVINNIMSNMIQKSDHPDQSSFSPEVDIIEIISLFSTKSKGGKWANLEEELLQQLLHFEEHYDKFFDVATSKLDKLIHCLSFADSCDEMRLHFGFLEALTESLLMSSSNPRIREALASMADEGAKCEPSLAAVYAMVRNSTADEGSREPNQHKIIAELLRGSASFLGILEEPSLSNLTDLVFALNQLVVYLDENKMVLEKFTESGTMEDIFPVLQNFRKSVNRVMQLGKDNLLKETELGNHLDNLLKGLDLILDKGWSRRQIRRTTPLKDMTAEEELKKRLTAIMKTDSTIDLDPIFGKEISLQKIQDFLANDLNVLVALSPPLPSNHTENPPPPVERAGITQPNIHLPTHNFETTLIVLKETNISLIFLQIEKENLHEMLRLKNISELDLQSTYLKVNYEAAMVEKLRGILEFIVRIMSRETKVIFQKLIQANSDKRTLQRKFIELFLRDLKTATCKFSSEGTGQTETVPSLAILAKKHRKLSGFFEQEEVSCLHLQNAFFAKEFPKQREMLGDGTLLVGPDTPFTRAFVTSAKESFEQVASHRLFLDNLQQILESVCLDSSSRNASERAAKVLRFARWVFPTLEYSFAVNLELVEGHLKDADHFCSFLHPNNEVLLSVLRGLSQVFRCFGSDKFKITNSENDFDSQFRNLLRKNQLIGGVFFSGLRSEVVSSPRHRFGHTLKMSLPRGGNSLHFPRRYWRPSQPLANAAARKVLPENALQLQSLTNNAILEITFLFMNPYTLFAGMWPLYLAWIISELEFFEEVSESASFILLLTFTLFASFVLIITVIFADHQTGQEEEIRVVHWSWLATEVSSLIGSCVLLAALFAALATGLVKCTTLFPRSESSLLFTLVFLFAMNLLVISHVVTSVIHSKWKSVVIAEVLLFVLALPFVGVMTLTSPPSSQCLILTCLFPPSCFAFGLRSLLQFERLGVGGSFVRLWILPTEDDDLSLAALILILLLHLFWLSAVSVFRKMILLKGDRGPLTCSYGRPDENRSGEAESPQILMNKRENVNIFHEHRSSIQRTLSGVHLRTVKAVGLQKLFLGKGRRPAVVGENLSFEAFQNQVFVFYGPPNSGKTTVLSMIAGLTDPSSGYVTVHGSPPGEEALKKKTLLSFCPSSVQSWGFMTVAEVLLYFSLLKSDLSSLAAKQKIERLLLDLELGSWKNSLVSRLSKSLQKCVSIATSFAGDSKIILLDEPFKGVERAHIRPIWKLISKTKKEKTFIIASKETEEIECLADVVGILEMGKLIYTGSPSSLIEEFSPGYTVNIYNKQNIRMLFNVEQRIEDLRDHLLNYISNASFKSFDHEQGEIKFQLPYCDVQQHPEKLCALFRDLEMKSEEMGISHVKVCHPSLKSILNFVVSNYGRGEGVTRTSLDLLDLGAGFQRSSFPNFGSREIQPEWKRHLNALKVLLWKRVLHNCRQMKMNLTVIVLPVLLFILAMTSFRLIPSSSPNETWNTLVVHKSDILNGFYAFPKEIYHHMAFERELESVLKGENGDDSRISPIKCDIFEVKKNFLFKRDLPCVPPDNDTVNFSDCSCFEDECVLKLIVGWHKLVIPFNKRHLKILPFLEWSYLENHQTKGVLFYDKLNPKSLFSLNAALASARIREFSDERNTSDLLLRSLHTPVTEMDNSFDFLGTQLVLLVPSALFLAGLTVGSVETSSQVIDETKRGEKRMLTVSGVHRLIYWGSFFAWDAVIVASNVTLLVVIVAAFNPPRLIAAHQFVPFCFLAFLYGWSIKMVTYILGRLGVDGFSLSTIIHVIIGVFCWFVAFFCQEFANRQDVNSLRKVLHGLFLLLPQYAWISGAITLTSLPNRNPVEIIDGPSPPSMVSSSGDSVGVQCLALFLWASLGCALLLLLEMKSDLRDRLDRRQRRSSESDEESRSETYGDSNLSLLISGLKFDVGNNSLDSSTVHFDAYACRGECLTIVGMKPEEKEILIQFLTGEATAPDGVIHLVNETGSRTNFDISDNLIGLYAGTTSLNPRLKVDEELWITAHLRGVARREMPEVLARTMRIFDLAENRTDYVRNLANDVKKRVALAKAVIGEPQIVLLDQPNEYASVTTRKIVSNLIKTITFTNRTVIMLSNCLEEAESISDRLAVFENGRVVHIGKMDSQQSSMKGRYLVKIQAEDGDDIIPITDLIKQEIQEFTIIEKYNAKIIADTSSEVTPYSIFGAISKARTVASFWFEVSSVSLPQYYQRLGLHPTRNSSYSSTGESLVNEEPTSLLNEGDSCSTVTLPFWGKSGRDSFYDNLEDDFVVQEKCIGHRRTLSNRVRRGSGSSKLTPCSTPQPPRNSVEGNLPTSSGERKCLSSPRSSIEQITLANQGSISFRRNASVHLKLPADSSLVAPNINILQMSAHSRIPEEVPMKEIRVYHSPVKNPEIMERFIENLPELAPRASIESTDGTLSETLEEEETATEYSSSEDRTEF